MYREDGALIPMLESPIPGVQQLAQQYAAHGQGCGKCRHPLIYSCPKSGFPSHCCEVCYKEDKAHQDYAPKLREVYEDLVDLRSGRKFPEFNFPGPPTHEWQRSELINWRAYLSDRRFNGQDSVIGNARSDEELAREQQSIRHISSVFTFPLTIAHAIYWTRVLGDPSKLDQKLDEDGNKLPWRIAVLGPRKEATMPARSWAELLAVFPEASFHIHLVGPEIPEKLHEQKTEILTGQLTAEWTRAEYQEVHEYTDLPDLFVTFNSGMGFNSTVEGRNSWDDALDLIFHDTGFTPLLMTSHSREDSGKDYAYVSRRNDCRFTVHPAENPFMALNTDAAVNNIRNHINTNHTYAVVKGAPPSGVIGGSLYERLTQALSAS
eukprot:CAMPEP_0173458716 /NCGR_PEP_ID=MMETSP1357-20121228/60090_1 /TAXON_ID=77926 /ORGANISM="Hemiselmis rufescens, Strain PCC563" /LENGTH=377 /DNA_ID=CAMNT_0014426109 /DNA_START=12 /DNA_END=1145 /DNA_ORIENTATION=+